jgi:hypothetical protein
LTFRGRVTPGIGLFSLQIVVPGRAQLGADAPPDWPALLSPGTLNVRVSSNGWPDAIDQRRQIEQVDNGEFRPALVIPHQRIENNTLGPREGHPLCGTGQAWRAEFSIRDQKASCWILRRIGSGYRDVIELVSDSNLRAKYSLTDDDSVLLDAWHT